MIVQQRIIHIHLYNSDISIVIVTVLCCKAKVLLLAFGAMRRARMASAVWKRQRPQRLTLLYEKDDLEAEEGDA